MYRFCCNMYAMAKKLLKVTIHRKKSVLLNGVSWYLLFKRISLRDAPINIRKFGTCLIMPISSLFRIIPQILSLLQQRMAYVSSGVYTEMLVRAGATAAPPSSKTSFFDKVIIGSCIRPFGQPRSVETFPRNSVRVT